MPLDDLDRARYEQALLELRTLQRVAEELSRSLDLEVVSARCLDLMIEAAHAVGGVMYLMEPPQMMRRMVQRHLDEEVAPLLLPDAAARQALTGSSSQMEITPDSDSPRARAAWQRGIRHVITLALRQNQGELVGFVTVHFPERQELAASTMQTLEAIARQESAAIANARTHQMVERSVRMSEGLRELSERALSCTDHDELCRIILETGVRVTHTNRGVISRVEGAEIAVIAAIGNDRALLGARYPVETPYIREVLAEPGVRVFENIEEFAPDSVIGQTLRKMGTGAFMTVTMRHAGKTVATMGVVSSEPRHFAEDEREAMQLIAAVGAAAIERVRALDRLASEKRRLDAVLEHLPMGVSVIGPAGELLHINAAARDFNDWLGASGNWRETVNRIQLFNRDGQPVPRDDLMVVRAFRGQTSSPSEMTVIASDGKSKKHVLAMAAPLFGADGKVEAVVSSQQDVTALRELADAKDHFLRIASHELRSPLTSLRATTSLLEMDPSAIVNPERRGLLLDRVQRQTARLTRLVEQLIDSVRLNATEPPLERVETDLVELCKEVIAALPDSARVKLEGDASVHGVWDGPRLEQVLSNLLSNAARYSHNEITVRVQERDHHATVEVIDRGIGIPADLRERLFTPFFRAPNAAAQSKGGLGLGLHIAHEIVRRHGGSLTVTSELGRGSTFRVDLPVDTTPPSG